MTEKQKVQRGDQIVITRSPMGDGISLSVHLAPKDGGYIGQAAQNFTLEEALDYIREAYEVS